AFEYSLEMRKGINTSKHLSFYTIFLICKEFRGAIFASKKSNHPLKLLSLANDCILVNYV
ncbi:hypothetical protein, partial [Listeria innocua]|uniref:hypothetical protein n=1 Tax=Listeria innocua TaxID=1642 RepID=UPI0004F2E69F